MTDSRPFGLADLLDRLRLHRLAGPLTYDRAFDYARDRRVGSITATEDAISATVRGTRPYQASLELVDDELAWECDCPVGVDGELCKHAVALGLAWLEEREAVVPGATTEERIAVAPSLGGRKAFGITWEEATAWMRTLEVAALVDILRSEAEGDDGLRQRLITRAAAGRQDAGAVTALRRSLDRAIHIRDFVPYREAQGYAEGIHAVIDRMDELLAAGAADAVIDLAEDALRSLEDVMGVIDDSDGEVGGVKERLEDLHLAACEAASPDPIELAGRLFAWETGSEWEVFYGAARRYADVLGPGGLAEYRRLAEAVWVTMPSLGPGERRIVDDGQGRPERGPSRFRITAIMETLADLAGDTDGLIEVMAHDLSYAYHYLQIAQVCQAAGREDEAIAWAERGVHAFPVRTDGRLRMFLADRYQARGRHDEAMAMVWAEFAEEPTVGHYRQLEASATLVDAWPAWRDRALAHARSLIEDRAEDQGSDPLAGWRDWPARRDASVLVELLLADGDVDAAWSAASAHGCRRALWLALARARETDHPLDAVPIYQREVEHLIDTKRNDGYRQAVVLIGGIRRLLDAGGHGADGQPYIADLRARHRQKRNFITALEGGRIGR